MVEARMTEEMIASMRSKSGMELRIDECRNNDQANRWTILRFAEGIGDTNPLWTDPDYAATTKYGTLVGPPTWPFCCFAGVQFGWPGLGAFHSGSDITFHRPVMVGDRIEPRCIYEGFDGPAPSKFAGKSVVDRFRHDYHNQRGELVLESVATCVRYERGEAKSRADKRPVTLPHPWTADEINEIEAAVLAETCRGSDPRWWEDVEVGDELDSVTKGPLGLTDEIAFVASGAAPIPRIAANRASLQQYAAHPAWSFRDPDTAAKEPIYAVHYNHNAARAMGVAASYDVGIQRTCWQVHLLTNWIGDDAWLCRAKSEYRGFVFLSDVIRLGGRVTGKSIAPNGDHLVTVETWATNQRGQNVMPGSATIALPTRNGEHPLQHRLPSI
ncbi:FAS1-like dehydratase domain-containing protein [[Mycobacterium] wendilense]|uniref:MaoC family dehydratase N-terminal domain-containing protein n=1 Tax=[Mycobacterium] wendilense TaxID=3064284 RepID=A0ABM9MJM4_9MYCO|nr:MaoC family dehydratase N-terminal domain-containing protein [Mycolicibacterium sp. MU0050]CAJ1586862.1 MaoC family dehydratase N-terminal domain-containing protein [Mycolicibacterium sp. MU0050]